MAISEDQHTESGWVRVADLEDIPPGKVKSVRIGEARYAIVNLDGELFAMDALCPHRYGPLDQGDVKSGGDISCPWHMFRFDPKTGRCTAPEDAYPPLQQFAVRVVDDGVELLPTDGEQP